MTENKFNKQSHFNIERIGWIVAMGLIIGSPFAILSQSVPARETHRDLARKVAMYHYQPVGNGGALAEMNGRVSAERTAMYDQIQEIYSQGMFSRSTVELEEEYKRLESGGSRIDRQQLRERIRWKLGNLGDF